MARVVMVTGVSRYLGGRFTQLLQADPDITRVIGVDVVPPKQDLGDAEFVRADIRNPVIGKVIAQAEVDTVVHMAVLATPLDAGGRATMKEINVIGTMQLLAACQKAPSVRKLVVKSSTAVYGSSPQDPAMFTEDMEPNALARSGYAKDSVEVEGYVRGFARRRPDVTVTTLRFANFVGPKVKTPLTSYFSLPVVPTVLGFDPRLQFVHERDGLEVLWRVHARRPRRHLQRRRRRRDAALAGDPAGRPPVVPVAAACGAVDRLGHQAARHRRLLAGADALPGLRPGGRHGADARRPRLHPALLDPRGVRRLRAPGRASPARCLRTTCRRSSAPCSTS